MRFRIWITGLAVAVALAAPARGDNESQRRTLAGLKSLHVHVDLRGDGLESFDLTEIALRPEVESKLAAAGLVLVDPEGSTHVPGVPWLFLAVNVLKAPDAKEYAWSIQLQLQQRACLERDRSVCESVGTWENHRLGSVGRRRVKTLHDDVLDLVTQFVSAWLAANPHR